jgi:uncharacterized protein (DUF2267 family)
MTKKESHVPAFETTLLATHEWLQELEYLASLRNQAEAYTVLRNVLHALRDRLPADEAVHLGAQLPMLIRGFYFEGWKPSATPKKQRSLPAFLSSIGPLPRPYDAFDAEEAVRCVLQLLDHRISLGELSDVYHAMPEEVRAFWTACTGESVSAA